MSNDWMTNPLLVLVAVIAVGYPLGHFRGRYGGVGGPLYRD